MIDAVLLRHASRNLPRYTSYPTALHFLEADAGPAAAALAHAARNSESLSVYVHVPFCARLCWYCGCHTTVMNGYDRVASFRETLGREVELWLAAAEPTQALQHLHFGGGSPNALSPEHFLSLVSQIVGGFGLRPGAEIAVELDPGTLSDAFIGAVGAAGVTRSSLGVQTLDAEVQRKVNRVQPFDMVAAAVEKLRCVGVSAVNFDLMYGLPGQTPESVAQTVREAVSLRPDRLAVFGYAHVPWAKKHQVMIAETELADVAGRWEQADAADEALRAAGYERVGLDHYALPEDALAIAARSGALRRNFQGYTVDPAPVLIPLGASSIGQHAAGFAQNAVRTDDWVEAVASGRLPIAKGLAQTNDDLLRAAVIERLMCDLRVDVGAICRRHGFAEDHLDAEVVRAASLVPDGLCAVFGRTVVADPAAYRLVRAVAAAFDAHLAPAESRHAKAV